MLENFEINTSANPPIASIIWLHGLGADGHDFVDFVPQLNLSAHLSVRFIFPHAPIRPVTLNNGVPMRAWYDILGLSALSREDEPGIREAQKQIAELIEQEHLRGIPYHRIFLGGFSQGGAVALFTGLRYAKLGGIIALSTYLPLAKTLPAEIAAEHTHLPIFIAHGTDDPVIPLAWGRFTYETLKKLHCPIEWHEYSMQHSVCPKEIADIKSWLEKALST